MVFDNNDAMQKKWKAFVHKIETKTDDFSKVIGVINLFFAEPVMSVVKSKIFNKNDLLKMASGNN